MTTSASLLLKTCLRWCCFWLLGCWVADLSWASAATGPVLEVVRQGSSVPDAPVTPSIVAWGWNQDGQTTVPAGLSNVVAVAAGYQHTLALKDDGKVVAWGLNTDDQCNVPAGLSGVVAIAAGPRHSVALKQDGTVVTWGVTSYPFGALWPPAGLSGVVAIAVGADHVMALKNNGKVVAWGWNYYSQTSVPTDLGGVEAIAAGSLNSVALKKDGTVVAWGNNGSGESRVPTGLSGVVAIAAGSYHTVALKNDGSIVAWGSNDSGQLTTPAGLTGVKTIAASRSHTVALKQDGTVVAWGGNDYGETSVPAGLKDVRAVAGGWYHTVALVGARPIDLGAVALGQVSDFTLTLASKGTVDVADLSAQLTGAQMDQFSIVGPALPATLAPGASASLTVRFTAKGSGPRHAVLRLTSSDPNFHPYLVNITATAKTPGLTISSPTAIAAGSTVPMGIVTLGAPPVVRTFTASNNGNDSLDGLAFSIDGTNASEFVVTPPTQTSIATASSQTFTVTFTPAGVGLRTATLHIASNDPNHNPFDLILTGQGSAIDISFAGVGGARLQRPDQAVNLGMIASGNNVERRFVFTNKGERALTGLRLVAEGVDAAQLSLVTPLPDTLGAGESITVTVHFTGFLRGLRAATLRLVTDDPNEATAAINFSVSVQAPRLEVKYANLPLDPAAHERFLVNWSRFNQDTVTPNSSAIAAMYGGPGNIVGLNQDGTVVGLGGNAFQVNVPKGLAGVVAIAVGEEHFLALKQDGTVAAWGSNEYGQANVPKGLSGVVAIAAGRVRSMALKRDGSIVVWGYDYSGQLQPPRGLTGVVSMAAGWTHTVALRYDGSVVAWGQHWGFQTHVPKGLGRVVAIAAARNQTLALKQDGSVVAWDNGGDSVAPVPKGLSGVVAIDTGTNYSLALKQDGSLVDWGYNTYSGTLVPSYVTGVVAMAATSSSGAALIDPAGDFGPVPIGFGPEATGRFHRIFIENGGDLDLLATVTIEGPDADQFKVDGRPIFKLNYRSDDVPLTVRFAPYRTGPMRATLKITTNDPATPSYKLDLTGTGIYVSSDATKPGVAGSSLTYGPLVTDRATGLIVQKITFTNRLATDFYGLRLLVSNVTPGITVQSSSATNKPGVVEVIYSKPIARGETVSLTLTYHDPQRRTNVLPIIHAESLAEPEPREGPRDGVLVPILSVRDSANGPVLQWNGVAKKTYVVEYSDDAGKTWYSAVHRLVAGNTRLLWTDRGQPETWDKPVNKAGRLYRVKSER